MNQVTDITALSNSIANGIATEQDTGLVLRTVQTALGCSLIKTLETVNTSFSKLDSLLNKCVDKFCTQVDQLLESDTIDHESLFELITTLQKNQVAFAELQRKIVQSPNKIFSDELLSTDEKKLLTLLKSFKTPQEKKNFLLAVDNALKPSGTNDF